MFHVFTPTALPPDGNETLPELPQVSSVDFALRVLLIEDDTAISTGTAEALRLLELHVDVTQTGARAAEAVRRFDPDVVILDIALPDVSGLDVFREIRNSTSGLPVIFFTRHADRTTEEPLLSNDVAFLRKPYSTQTCYKRSPMSRRGSAQRGVNASPYRASGGCEKPRVGARADEEKRGRKWLGGLAEYRSAVLACV